MDLTPGHPAPEDDEQRAEAARPAPSARADGGAGPEHDQAAAAASRIADLPNAPRAHQAASQHKAASASDAWGAADAATPDGAAGPPASAGSFPSRPEGAAGAGPGRKASARPTRKPGQEIGGRKFRVTAEGAYVPFRYRTKRRRRAIALGIAVLLMIGAATYGVLTLIGPGRSAEAGACTEAGRAGATQSRAAAQALVAQQITVNVYNATNRQGLAKTTAEALKQRGFVIGKVANDPLNSHLAAAAQIRGNAAALGRMQYVAAEVAGAQLQQDTRTDQTVDLVIGTAFTDLATPAQVTATLNAAEAAAATAATAAPQTVTVGGCGKAG